MNSTKFMTSMINNSLMRIFFWMIPKLNPSSKKYTPKFNCFLIHQTKKHIFQVSTSTTLTLLTIIISNIFITPGTNKLLRLSMLFKILSKIFNPFRASLAPDNKMLLILFNSLKFIFKVAPSSPKVESTNSLSFTHKKVWKNCFKHLEF